MKKLILLILLSIFANYAFATEQGLDPITTIKNANLVCGKVDGKFIIFSAQKNKIWYVIADQDKDTDNVLRNSRYVSDLKGLKAYSYSLVNNNYSLPSIERGFGSALVTYKLTYGYNSTVLWVKNDSSGSLRLVKGERGRNGRCWFLENP